MRLPLFFPLAFALIAGMVWLSLRPGFARDEEWRSTLREAAESGFVVEGARLDSLIHNERASFELSGPSHARRAIIGSLGDVTEENNGVHYFLPSDVTRVLDSPALDVSFEVRSPPELGSTGWMARCAIRGEFDTGWVPLEVGPDWSASTLSCPTDHYRGVEPLQLIMWSDANGDGGRVELRRITITRAG